MWVLLFDVDHPLAAMAWDAAGLPPPTWTAQNPENGHAHIAYALSAPVAKSDAARLKPLRLLARIQHAMTDALSADRGYVGLITKTPNHARWCTTVGRP
ncbi:Rep protein CDS [Salmonella enterica subsp. enterica serovar Derby]|nr:Rep protein CDS [Salmonella enterica subsp. enterica serovar Derby]